MNDAKIGFRACRSFLKSTALITAFIFCFNQIVFAEGMLTQEYVPNPNQPVVAAISVPANSSVSTVQPSTTTDFLSSNSSPLSAPAVESEASVSVLEITSPVSGTVTINSGAAYTTSRTVTLNLSATSTAGSLSKMSFSSNGTTWSSPVTYTASKSYTLASGDGMKTVYVKYYDNAGNQSAVYSTSIILDTKAPLGTVKVNNGAAYINQTVVTLNLSATDSGSGLDKMSFSANGTTWSAAEIYATTKAWTFAPGDGSKKVYAKFLDKAGKWSKVVSVTVTLDTVKPTGSININSSALYATSQTVTLKLSATDNRSGISTMSFSTDGTNWAAPVAYATSKAFTLPAGDGTKTVFVKYYDKAGNESAVYSKSIILETLPPSGTIQVNGGAQFINQTSVTLNLLAEDAGSGLSKMSFSSNGTTWSVAEAYAAAKSWAFSSGDGNKTVYAKFQDKYGRWSSPVSVTVTLDTVKPTGSININSGASETNSVNVTLNLAATDGGSGMNTMSFSTDNVSWTVPEVFAASRAFTLPEGDGPKTVFVRFYDNAGNVSTVFSRNIQLKTVAPVVVIDPETPTLINQKALTIDYTSDGVAKRKTFTDLIEGENMLSITETGLSGISTTVTFNVTVDTIAPEVVLDANTPSLINMKTLVVTYAADGISKTKEFTGLAEGINHLSITETDAAGNPATTSFDVTVDTIALEVVLDANTPSLIKVKTLTINYTLDGIAKTKNFTDLVEGENTLTITEIDLAGNQTTVTRSVTVDTIAPVVVIDPATPTLINTKMLMVNYTVDGVSKAKTFTDLTEGENDLSITETDLVGNQTTTNLFVTVDSVVPSGSVLINDGASYTNASEVRVTVGAWDNLSEPGRVEVSFSKDGVHFSLETIYVPTNGTSPFYLITLDGADGDKTLYIRLQDEAGNVAILSRKIILERTPPQGSISLNGYPSNDYFYDFPVMLNLNATDSLSGVSLMRFSLDGGSLWTDWESYQTTRTISWQEAMSLHDYNGTNPVIFSVEYKDFAGNVGRESFESTPDGELPQGTISINGGAEYTHDREVTLDLTAHDSISGVRGIQIQVLNQDGSFYSDTGLIPFESSKAVTLPEGDGSKSVVYMVCDWVSCISFSDAILLDTTAPILVVDPTTPVLIYDKALTVLYTADGIAKTRTFTDLAEGENTLTITETDLAGNISTVNWIVTVDAMAPKIIFTSPATMAGSDYLLTYTVDGVARQENWHLAPGSNLLVIETEKNAISYFSTYQVNCSNPSPVLLTDALGQDDSMHFNLDLTQMSTDSGESLAVLLGAASAELRDAHFDSEGRLTDAILKFQDGRAIQLLNGKIRQILDPSGSLQLYSSAGELETVVNSDGARSNLPARLSDFITRNLLGTVAGSSNDVALYDSQGRLRYGANNNETILYDEGILKQITSLGGAIFYYQCTPLPEGGYEARLSETAGGSGVKPAVLRYDATKKLVYVESSDGSKFEFENGVLTRTFNAGGEETTYSYDNSALGDFLDFHVNRAGVQRTYDEQGNLAEIITGQGVTTHVENNTITKLDLGNGQYATDFQFDGDGNIIDVKLHNVDGSISRYASGVMTEMELPDHSVLAFSDGKARTLTTADGRNYRYVYAMDGAGNETSQALRAELVSYTSQSGNILELTDSSLNDFTLQGQNPLDSFAGGTPAQATLTFIPILSTPTNLIRNLQLDTDGKMISAEILNRSGDQYFIVNQKLERIVTADGKVLTFNDNAMQPPAVTSVPLTSDETAFRDQLLEQNLQYFQSGQGIDPESGLPFDYLKEDGTPERITQPTAIGFYLQILGAVIDGSYTSSSMTKQEALSAAQKALGSLLTMQSQVGWRGLIPFANIGSPFTRYGNGIGFGDNANLSQSLAVLIGSVENAKIAAQLDLTGLNGLISQAETFIDNQEQGFSSFYDSGAGLFRSSYDVSTGIYTGFNDRLFNEFRTGAAFVITRFNFPQQSWDNLVTVTRYYQDQDFQKVLNAVPFDGGAFQMFWPLIRAGQELKPEMEAAAWNFLYSMADYAVENHLPGFPSASFDPTTGDFEGKIGVPELAETRDALNSRTVSVYALASAYALAPQFVLSWLKAIQTQYPSVMGPYGFYDSLAMPPEGTIGEPSVGKRVYAVDQGSFLLGLLNNAGTDFNKYLDTRGYRTAFDGLYDRVRLNITPVDKNLTVSPFGTEQLLSVQPPQAPPSGFCLTGITNPQNGQVDFDYLLSPEGALSDVRVQYDSGGVRRTTDLLTYFEQTLNRDEINYLLNAPPVNLFDQNVEQGSVFTPGQGNSVESRVQDTTRGFVKAFDYQVVPGGKPVGYYAKFNDLNLSDVDFLTFSVRRDPGSTVPKALEVKLEGLGESFIIDSIPTSWTRVVLPLKKPNTDLSKVAILIHDQVSQAQSGRVYLGDISLFSLKDYSEASWQSRTGLTPVQIESLARDYLTSGTPPPAGQTNTVLSDITLTSTGDIDSAKVQAKNGALLFINGGKVTKVVTPDGKTVIYKNGNADTVTDLSGETASFSYKRDFKEDIQEVIMSELGIQRVYGVDGDLKRLVFKGLSGGLSEGILTSIRTRFESVTELVGDEFGHIKNATISLNDGRVLYIENYKLVKMLLLSGTEVAYDADGYIASIRSKDGYSEYLYQKDISGRVTSVDVQYVKDGQTIVANVVTFLREENRVEEAAILLESPLINLTEIASNIGAFYTTGRGYVSEHEVTDPSRNDVLQIDYSIPSNPTYMGIYFRFPNLDLSQYQLMNVAIRGEGTGALPSVTIELKGPGNDRVELNNITSTWTDENVPIDNLNSSIYEVTMLINPEQLNVSGTLYLNDISFFNIRKMDVQAWQEQLSFNGADLELFSNEITKAPLVDPLLYQVNVPDFQDLKDFNNFPTVLSFDPEGRIRQFTRGDGAQVTLTEDLPSLTLLPNGQTISYMVDANTRRITGATVTDSENQTSATTQYSYDHVRHVVLENGEALDYYYEFDDLGNEVTVVKDPGTGETKRFVNGLIKSADNGSGLVTTYAFENGQLKESNLSFQGKADLDLTQYEKRGDKTLITDRSGMTWIYDAQGVLAQHRTPDGFLYQHTTGTNEHGEIQHLIFLIECAKEDGTILYYENGEISRIVFANGVSFVSPHYDEDHNLSGATVLYEDGSEVDYVNQFAVKVADLFGDVTTYELPAGKIFLESDPSGRVEFLRIERDGMTLRYDRDGDLVNLITADDTLYQYVYETKEGVKTGRMKIYRRELARVAGIPVPFPVSAEVNGYGDTHVLVNGSLVYTAFNKVRVVALHPETGAVDASAAFDMSFPNMGAEILNFVSALPDGEYVMIIYPPTSTGYSSDASNFMTALELIGGDRTKAYMSTKPWMVLGQKGILPGQACDSFKTYAFSDGTTRLDTEKRDVFYLDADHQTISHSAFGFSSTLLDTTRHGNYLEEMTEVFGTVVDGSETYAAAYFKNYNIKYPQSGLYRFLGDFEDQNFIEVPAADLNAQLGGLLDFANSFTDKVIYYDERYPVQGIAVNNLRALKGYLVSKGFRVVNADQLKTWLTERGPDSLVLMAQDIAPDTIVDLASSGVQLPRSYVDRGGSFIWLYDIPFYQIGHSNGTKQFWNGEGDNDGLRRVFGISTAYEPASSKPVSLYSVTPVMGLDASVMTQPLHLDFDIRELDAWQDIRTQFEQSLPPAPTDIASVFDQDGVIVGVRKADGTQNVFEDGKLRSILDRQGVHLIDYLYNTAGELIATDYLKARQELVSQIQNAELQVARLKTMALLQVATSHTGGVQDIQTQLMAARTSLAGSRAQVESQRYVTQCFKCGCDTCCEKQENPGYRSAMANVVAAERQVEADAAAALAGLDSDVANAYQQIGRDESDSIDKIRTKQDEVARSILQNEITPVLMQFYRLLLGRDPSTIEMTRWIDAAVSDPQNRVDAEALKTELLASPERATRLAEVAAIKADVRAALDQYVAASGDARVSQAASYGLLASEIVSLTAEQVAKIAAFLDGQNLHFGYSAFMPLQAFLKQNNLNVSTHDIAVKALLIDVLTGTINPFAEGNLEISLFALERTAKVLGAAPNASKLTFDELKQLYAANSGLKTVVHIKGNHYVTLIGVTDDKVSYIESAMGGAEVPGMGAKGEIVEVSKAQFLELWYNDLLTQTDQAGNAQAMGAVLLPDQIQVQENRVLDSRVSKLIKGADCGISFLVAVIISAVIAGTVQAITATSGNFVVNFLKGFAFGAITGAVTFGIGAVLSGFASAVSSVASGVVNGIKTFVAPIVNGFKVLGSAVGSFITNVLPTSVGSFLGSVGNLIGQGITAIQSFGSTVLKVATSGFNKLASFIPVAAGIQKEVASALMLTAVGYGTNYGLTVLGVDPRIAGLASAFVTGGIAGAINSVGTTVDGIMIGSDNVPIGSMTVSSPYASIVDGFVKGGITGLTLEGIPVLGQAFGLSPETTNILRIASSAFLGAGGNMTDDILKGLGKNLVDELAITGLTALGNRIGLDARITGILGVSFRSTISELTNALVNSNGGGGPGVWTEIGKSILAGTVAAGASILIDQIDASEIVKGLGGLAISSMIEGLIPRTSIALGVNGEIQEPTTTRIGVLSSVLSAFAKSAVNFAGSIMSNSLAFSETVQNLGFKAALDLFIGSALQRQTVESLFKSTNDVAGLIVQKFNEQTTVVEYRPGIMAKEIQMEANGQKLVMVFDAQNKNLLEMRENGRLIEGDIRLDENGHIVIWNGTETVVENDGAIRFSQYEDRKLTFIQYRSDTMNLDYYTKDGTPLVFNANGALTNGVIENIDTGLRHIMENGVIKRTEQGLPLIQSTSNSDESRTYEEAILEVTHDSQGKVVTSRIKLDEKATINIDPEDLARIQAQSGEMLVYVDETGKPILAFDGKCVAIGADAETLVKEALNRFKTIPHGIQVPETGMLVRSAFDGNLAKQITDDGMLMATKNQISDADPDGLKSLRQVVFESKVTTPKGGIKLTQTTQQILLYGDAGQANEYIQSKFGGGSALYLTDKGPLPGFESDPNLFRVNKTVIQLDGSSPNEISGGAGGTFNYALSSSDPRVNGKQAQVTLAALTAIDNTASLVFSSQVKVDCQIFNVETKISPLPSLPGSSGPKAIDKMRSDLLDATIKAITAINTGQPIAPGTVMAPSLLAEAIASQISLDSSIKTGLEQSYEQLFTKLAEAHSIQTVSIQDLMGVL